MSHSEESGSYYSPTRCRITTERRKRPPTQTCGVFIVRLREQKTAEIDSQDMSANRDKFEVLLVHATHSSWQHWGIPKGLPDPGENWAQAACRELEEETGIAVTEEQLTYIGSINYPKRPKILNAFWLWADDIQKLLTTEKMSCSSLVTEDPKFPGAFPEVDAYRWFSLSTAEEVLHEPQRKMLQLLIDQLDYSSSSN